VLTVKEAQQRIFSSLNGKRTEIESIPVIDSLGRVTAEEIVAAEEVPSFTRSTMDGFAVRSSDTFGASESIPALLTLKGNILMGKEPPGNLEPGEAMSIPTGGMLPEGSDCVVMLEYSEVLGNQVVVYRPTAPLENVIRRGEDFQRGDTVLPAGHMIRSQDIGILSALGNLELKVYARPRVSIFSTGDEIVAPREKPQPGQIRDINGFALAAQVRESGGTPQYRGIIADEKEELKRGLLASLDDSDTIIISGGSSVGARDVAVKVIDELPGGGVLFHGVSMRPGKPVIYGISGDKPIFGLSGNPVSAMLSFILFVKPVLRLLQGLPAFPAFPPYVEASLDTNVSSPGGREDYVRVMLYREESSGGEAPLCARPVFGGAGLLSTMVKGDGYFVIPRDVEGISEGSKIKVFLF
jgi:molybdopterin molybdotransferase